MRKYLYLTVFVSGLTSLALEMAASRLMGNVFGTSNLVWASIIGLILIFLALGYFVGGPWADRSPRYTTFYQILTWAAIAIAVIPLTARPVMRLAANGFDQLQLGILFGSFASVMILLSVPTILLGAASPFAVRLALQGTVQAGGVAGRIYAVSTLGSFVGTFLPVLVLVPLIGIYRTFLALSILLMAFALFGLWFTAGWRKLLPYLWAPVVVIFLLVRGLPGTDKTTQGLIYEKDSAYNYIQVLEENGYHLLRLNEGQGVHSIYHPDTLRYFGPWEQVLVGPFFNPAPYDPANVKRIAIVGLAAGTTARQATAVFGPVQIDGIEIDPEIVRAGQQYFGMTMPNLNVIVQDGRWALEHSPHTYQIISVDAYRPPYIPAHLTTREFFQTAYDHLSADGVLVINVGRAPEDRRLINSLAATIGEIFPSIHVMDIPNTFNSILYATVQPTTPDNLINNIVYLEDSAQAHPLLTETARLTLAALQPAPEPGVVFTDDLAPIEWITNDMIVRYLFANPDAVQ